MRISIITIFDAYNYGSFLQAFAMQNFLEEKGHTVYMVDVRTSIKSVVAQKYFAKSLKRTIVKLKRFFAYRKAWSLLNIVGYQHPQTDISVIGSDEVWNIENQSFDHSDLYYGKDANSKKVIAYAPSIGYSTYDSYRNYPLLLRSIKDNISWFGTRDKFTADFLSQIGVNAKIENVCDPTILMYDKWKDFEADIDVSQPFLIYYSYLEDTPFKEFIMKFAKEKGLIVISVGFDYKWCDDQMIVSPLQFLTLVNKAQYVVTSTFHGTLFSTMYKKKFIEVNPARKAVDYLAQIGLERVAQYERGYDEFKKLLESDIDYVSIDEKLNSWRNRSSELFLSNISK